MRNTKRQLTEPQADKALADALQEFALDNGYIGKEDDYFDKGRSTDSIDRTRPNLRSDEF